MALLSKKAMNFAYGMGAAVVIVGALFKITTLNSVYNRKLMLMVLLVEAGILRFLPLKTWIMSLIGH
jgi:NADH:ubiquinone oxidoreductase subunit 6 (subunit J)